MGVEDETFFLTRYCFSLIISLGTYALRLCLVCVVDVRVRPRSSVGILEEALDLTVDLCTALFLHLFSHKVRSHSSRALCARVSVCGGALRAAVVPNALRKGLSGGVGDGRC